MRKYLSKFTYYSGYTDVVDTELTRPHVSYIEEEDRVIYDSSTSLGDHQIVAGDFVCYKDGIVSCVPYSKFSTAAGYTVIGIVAIPPTHTPDGTTRAISVVNMNYSNPENGSTAVEPGFLFGGYGVEITTLTNMPRALTWSNNTSAPAYSTSTDSYLPSDIITTGTTCTVDTTTQYVSGKAYSPSPYANGGVSEMYLQEKQGTYYNCLADMDGAGNTNKIMGLQTAVWSSGNITNSSDAGNYPMAAACKRFKTPGTMAGTWYLPSCGELGYVVARLKEIEASIAKVSGKPKLKTDMYVATSTESQNNTVKAISLSSGRIQNKSKNTNMRCRAFHKFYFD